MALYQFLCGLTVMIILSSKGCQSQHGPVCGRAVRNSRIVGGENASPGSWPWQVSLISNGTLYCSGSLINNQWVLTAAHCLTVHDLPTTEVFLGRHSQSGPNLNEESRQLDMIQCHPSYRFLTHDNDICLLRLSAPVNFTDYIQPVCLASAESTFHTGVSSWVTGFGSTQADSPTQADILQEVNLSVVGNNECQCTHRHLTDNMICAGFTAGGRDACQGDSGGALVTKNDSVWIQFGVVSFGEGCGEAMTPGVYTRVSGYQDWITNITGGSEVGFVTYISSGVDSDFYFYCPTLPSGTTTTAFPFYIFNFTTTCEGCDRGGGSVFDSGENVIHFSHLTHFTSLCLLVISLYVLVGDV
ncbi:serine protease 27-like [Epinephelus moara]|uniref:serine protease 27-like n=1 Tax=Epinephelus moara TaxID=300413 RepID=UPI00214F5101|nr:serine protease 27-like [Epinephelus moara]